MPPNNAAPGSTQRSKVQTKVQPWKAAYPPTNPASQSARPTLLTSGDGTPIVDVLVVIILAGRNSDPAQFSDLLADESHWVARED